MYIKGSFYIFKLYIIGSFYIGVIFSIFVITNACYTNQSCTCFGPFGFLCGQTYNFQRYDSEVGLLNKSSCQAQTVCVTKFINIKGMILVTLCCAT